MTRGVEEEKGYPKFILVAFLLAFFFLSEQ